LYFGLECVICAVRSAAPLRYGLIRVVRWSADRFSDAAVFLWPVIRSKTAMIETIERTAADFCRKMHGTDNLRSSSDVSSNAVAVA